MIRYPLRVRYDILIVYYNQAVNYICALLQVKQKETIKVYVKFYYAENETEKRVGGAEPAEEVLGAAPQGTGETAQRSGETP